MIKLGGHLNSKWHSVNAQRYLLSKYAYACLAISAEVLYLILVMCNLFLIRAKILNAASDFD